MPTFPCVVIGDVITTDPATLERADVTNFIERYKVNLPTQFDGGAEQSEASAYTQFSAREIIVPGGGGVGNQDGGNGSGGDAAGRGQHVVATVKTAAEMSFWKIDKRQPDLAFWSNFSTLSEAAQNQNKLDRRAAAKFRSPDVATAIAENTAPGSVFYFTNVEAAFAWLTSEPNEGGREIYDLYTRVRVVGVNAINAVATTSR